MRDRILTIFTTVGVLLGLAFPTWPQSRPTDLADRSLEELMNIEVTSVSKKQQSISHTASAIFVITQEEIRRSGATNIPDLLRMVPGVDVARINASKWAISARGFNGQYSNKLLVLIDGRTVYTPLLSGVFWDTQNVPLEDIERIEVIRGPGATVWGANAVNGVINIIRKSARETQGGLITGGAGTSNRAFGNARFGGTMGAHASYRIYSLGLAGGPSPDIFGRRANDDWHTVLGGFRVDANPTTRDSVTIQGDAQSGSTGEMASAMVSISPPLNGLLVLEDRFSAWNVLSRWNRVFSTRSETSLQVYFDRSTRGDATYGVGLNIFDIDFQHHVGWGERHDFVWGLSYRVSSDRTLTTERISFSPASRTTQLFGSFVQDEITLLPDRLFLTLGAKLERNGYTGSSLQPTARLTWTPSPKQMFWAAFSQADRTPARSDTNIRVNYASLPGPGLPLLVSLMGNPKFQNEVLRALEAGYRSDVNRRLSVDATVFYNHYHNLVSVEPGIPSLESNPAPLHMVVPSSFANLEYGETHGLEVFGNLQIAPRWTLSPGYSFLQMHIHAKAGSHDLTTAHGTEGSSPAQQAQLRSHVVLPGHWSWNTSAYFVGRLPALSVPSYTRLDTNLVWQLGESFSITLAGQNLLKSKHLEFTGPDSSVTSTLSERSGFLKLMWRF